MDTAAMKCMGAMMRGPVSPDSPSALYGQADNLGLSDEQKAKLMEIETDARQKALAVLTDEQRKKVRDLSSKPMTMMQMCQQMRARMMKPAVEAGDKGRPMMMCPMMERMSGQTDDKGGSTAKPTE